MKRVGLRGYALTIGAASALLAGCGGAQPPIGTLGPTSQSRADTTDSKSRATKGTVIYASTSADAYVISYPKGEVIGTFKSPPAHSICSDTNGNVFFPVSQEVFEYPHGGTHQIAVLKDGNYVSYGCAVDSRTGNLAVANGYNLDYSDPGNIAVFVGANGQPEYYGDPTITAYYSCTYDGEGNLFVVGRSQTSSFLLAELPYGSKTFRDVALDEPVNDFGEIHWDGKYLALATHERRQIYRLSVAGSQATVVGVTKLNGIRKRGETFAFLGSEALTPMGAYDRVIGNLGLSYGWKTSQNDRALFLQRSLH